MNVDQRHEERKMRLVRATAKLIMGEGNFSASVQEIAKKGEFSRTAINYYFDSKEAMMAEVRQYALGLWKSKIGKLLILGPPLEQRIVECVDFSLDLASDYPFLESFLSTGKGYNALLAETVDFSDLEVLSLFEEFGNAMQRGKIYAMDPVNYIINLLAITDQPFRILSSKNADDPEVRSFAAHFKQEKRAQILRSIFI